MKTMTRDELFLSDRGERAYYESKRSLKERIRLPLTLDGCNALLEIVTDSLELPLDETMAQVFAGYIHHLPQTENSTTLSDIGKVLYNHLAKAVTWKLDQDMKEKMAAKKEQAPKLNLAEGTDSGGGEPVS